MPPPHPPSIAATTSSHHCHHHFLFLVNLLPSDLPLSLWSMLIIIPFVKMPHVPRPSVVQPRTVRAWDQFEILPTCTKTNESIQQYGFQGNSNLRKKFIFPVNMAYNNVIICKTNLSPVLREERTSDRLQEPISTI